MINDIHKLLRHCLSPQTALHKIPSVLPLLLRRRSPHQLPADHRSVTPIRIVRVGLDIDRHSAVARHGPRRPAPSSRRVVRRFAVGCHRGVPEEDIMVGDGFAFGDAVALAVGDGAVQGVWVGVGGWGELVEREG